MKDRETTSRTERTTSVVERWVTGGDHFQTTITDGDNKVVATGSTAEQAEERASENWHSKE